MRARVQSGYPSFTVSAKNERDTHELLALKKLAAELLAYDDVSLTQAVSFGALIEVNCDEKTVP